MEIRVTIPFIVYFISGDQYGGPDCFISCLHVLFTEINQIKNTFMLPDVRLLSCCYCRDTYTGRFTMVNQKPLNTHI